MAATTELDITYGAAMAPPGFRRCTSLQGNEAALNPGISSTPPSYLWLSSSSSSSGTLPIVDLRIIKDKSATLPTGFELLDKNLLNATSSLTNEKAYLCYRRGNDKMPVGTIYVLNKADDSHLYTREEDEEPFQILQDAIIENEAANILVRLCFKRVKMEANGPERLLDMSSLRVGDILDVNVTRATKSSGSPPRWVVGEVISLERDSIVVQQRGTSIEFTFPVDGTSFATLGAHTADMAVLKNKLTAGTVWDIKADEIVNMVNLFDKYERYVQETECTEDVIGKMGPFWNYDLPFFVQRLVTSSYPNKQMIPVINKFIHTVLEKLVRNMLKNNHLSSGTLKFLMMLLGVDDKKTFYYNTYGQGHLQEDSGLSEKDLLLTGPCIRYMQGIGAAAGNKEACTTTSSLYYTNINYFCQIGGMEAIFNILKSLPHVSHRQDENAYQYDHNKCNTIDDLAYYIYLVTSLTPKLTPEFCDNYGTKFLDVSFQALSSFESSEYKKILINMKTLEVMLENLTYFGEQVCRRYPIHEKNELFRLYIGKYLLCSPDPSVRIRGASLLSNMVIWLTEKEQIIANKLPNKKAQVRWLTASIFCDWILSPENPSLGIIIGIPETMKEYGLDRAHHHEILKRSIQILSLLAREGKMSTEILDFLWAMTQSQEDVSLQRLQVVTFELLGGMAHFFSDELMNHIDLKISTTVSSSSSSSSSSSITTAVDIPFITFIAQIVKGIINARTTENNANKFGFQVIWSCVLHPNDDSTKSSEDLDLLTSRACEILGSILAGGVAKEFTIHTVERCVRYIAEKHPSTPAIMTALYHILEKQLPARGNKEDSFIQRDKNSPAEKLYNHAECHFQMTTTIISSIQEMIRGDVSKISIGFNLLDFILQNSNRELQPHEVEDLWSCVLSVGEVGITDRFIKWIGSICPTELANKALQNLVNVSMTVQCTDTIFYLILHDSQSILLSMNLSCYQTVEKLFRYVNFQKGHIIATHTTKAFVVLKPLEIIGIDALLKTYLLCEDESVAKSICQFLISLHSRIEPSCLEKKASLKRFASDCMDYIRLFIAQKNDPHFIGFNSRSLFRALKILTTFLIEITSSSLLPIPSERKGDYFKVLTRVSCSTSASTNATQPNFYNFRKDVTYGNIRARMASELGVSIDCIQLKTGNNNNKYIVQRKHDQVVPNVKDGGAVIIEVSILKNSVGSKHPCAFNVPLTLEEEPGSTEMAAREQLAQDDDTLKLLLELLEFEDTEIGEYAWNLLELLPMNPRLLHLIQTLDGYTTFEDNEDCGILENRLPYDILCTVLDSTISLTLLYKLSIVWDIISSTSKASIRWSASFLAAGGVSHLISLVTSTSNLSGTAECSKLQLRCHATLYRVVSSYLHVPPRNHFFRCDFMDAMAEFDEMVVSTSHIPKSTLKAILSSDKDTHDRDVAMEVKHAATCLLSNLRDALVSSHYDEPIDDVKSECNKNVIASTRFKGRGNDKTQSPIADLFCYCFEILLSTSCSADCAFINLFNFVYKFEGLVDILSHGLFKCADESVRCQAASKVLTFVELASVYDKASAVALFTDVVSMFGQLKDFSSKCSEAFSLMAQLSLQFGADLHRDQLKIICDLCNCVVCRDVVEESSSSLDSVLLGYVELLDATISSFENFDCNKLFDIWNDHQLCEKLLYDCIFALPKRHESRNNEDESVGPIFTPPKCKSSRNRQAIFQLVLHICRVAPQVRKSVLDFMKPYHNLSNLKLLEDGTTRYKASDYVLARSSTGYSGLVNPGCICYMISCLQQFYMVPSFRQSILNITLDDLNGASGDKENFLYHLQQVFGHLQNTDQFAHDLSTFCSVFKDFEGNPTDITEQQDASEFVTNFFQQLESMTMGSKYQNLLKDTFGGTFIHELLAEGGKYSERKEQFYFISLDISKTNLIDSLNLYVEDEKVDYTWESKDLSGGSIKESLSTTKRISVVSPPKHLLLHLKRFAFDFETMTQVKLNHRYEFPLELNIFPFTKQYRMVREGGNGVYDMVSTGDIMDEPSGEKTLEEKDCDYTLAGVVVHTGTANSGHYYSFIKERGCFSASELPSSFDMSGNWFEFNDSIVTDFDMSTLDNEAFGGISNNAGGKMKVKNAFMLVYDRVSGPSILPRKEVSDSVHKTTANRFIATIQEPLASQIWDENMEYWQIRNLFDSAHLEFLSEFLELQLKETEVRGSDNLDQLLVEIIPNFVFSTLVRAKSTSLLQKWLPRMSHLMLTSSSKSSEFLLSLTTVVGNRGCVVKLVDVLFEIDDTVCQKYAMEFLATAVRDTMPEDTSNLEALQGSVANQFLNAMTKLLRVAQQHWKNITHFFQPFYAFATKNKDACMFSIYNRGDMSRMIAFMLGEFNKRLELVDGSSESTSKSSRKMSDGHTTVCLQSFLLTLDVYLDCIVEEWKATMNINTSVPLCMLSQDDRNAIESKEFCIKLIKQCYNYQTKHFAVKILKLIIHKSQENTLYAMQAAIYVLKIEDGAAVKGPMRAIMTVLTVDDGLEKWRVEKFFPAVMNELLDDHRYLNATDVALVMLLRIMKRSSLVQNIMSKHTRQYGWIIEYMACRSEERTIPNSVMFKSKVANSSSKSPYVIPREAWDRYLSLARLMMNGRRSDSIDYDSDDDPSMIVGQKVAFRWQDGKWWHGTIKAYNSEDYTHHIVYDDGDERHYKLSEKNFKFL